MRISIGAVLCLCLVTPATAKEEPFGQETVEVRPYRNPPRPGAAPHRHKHDHQHAAGHDHKHEHPGSHGHTHGRTHSHRDRDGHSHADGSEPHGHEHTNGHHHHGIETEHLFGFTTGTDIDPPGAKHAIIELDGRFTKQSGSYAAFSQRFEYAFTPWRDFHLGLNASFAAHNISGVDGLDDRRSATFEGIGVEFRQRLLDRTQAPFGLQDAVAPASPARSA